ncbi:uncharacterized protein LOC117201496 isoform X1 [Orcinus orca]|uniref:uncharacterized protein LOC117201496 isoform X1 n=1 Tax=Orcinus orca TaxID=9733 RepID=UPI0021132656|nr:uncharacterized protein LOC117201496 isoform X1 [Orcinus orca]XP_033284954.2 uncharacterized protein LOC117201496 isoform X1 [Orcinus orca]
MLLPVDAGVWGWGPSGDTKNLEGGWKPPSPRRSLFSHHKEAQNMSYWMRPFLGRLGYPRCSPASTSPKPRWAQPPPGGPTLGLDLLRLCPPSSSRLPEPGGRGWGSKFKPQASAWELRALLISQPLSLNCTGSATGRIQDTGPRPPSPMQVPVVRGLRESNCTRNLSPGPPLPVVEGGQGDCSQTRRSSWDGKGRERPTCLNTVELGSEHPGGADDPTCQLPGMMALGVSPLCQHQGLCPPGEPRPPLPSRRLCKTSREVAVWDALHGAPSSGRARRPAGLRGRPHSCCNGSNNHYHNPVRVETAPTVTTAKAAAAAVTKTTHNHDRFLDTDCIMLDKVKVSPFISSEYFLGKITE